MPKNNDKYKRYKGSLSEKPLTGYWQLLTGRRALFLSAVFVRILGSFFYTSAFFLVRYFIDEVLVKENWQAPVVLIAAGYVALNVCGGILVFFKNKAGANVAENIALSVRNTVFDHIQRLNFTYHDKMQTGELVQRATTDLDAMRRFYTDQVLEISRITGLFLINFAVIFSFNGLLALMSSLAVPAIIVLSVFFFKRIFNAYNAYEEQDGHLTAVLQENLSGIRVVRAFARQEYEKNKFDGQNREKFRLGKIFMFNHALYWPSSHLICTVQVMIGYAVGAWLALNGTITLGTFLAFAVLVHRIIWPLQQMGRVVAHLSTSFVSYRRVTSILREEKEELFDDATDSKKLKGELVIRNLSFGFNKGAPVLKDINLEVKPGQVIALMGGAGSGKTALVNLLPRFYEYTKGTILLDGKPLKSYTRHFLRAQIGIVEQEPFLFSVSLRENIAYGAHREVSPAEIEQAAQAAAIHESILGFPQGYDTLVGEKGVTLSGGQKQRIAIARALLKDPALLILDDSTSSVDSGTEQKIQAALKTLMQGRTTFIIAHRIETLRHAGQILVFDKGGIIQQGTHKELAAQKGFYRDVYRLQTRIETELQEELQNAV